MTSSISTLGAAPAVTLALSGSASAGRHFSEWPDRGDRTPLEAVVELVANVDTDFLCDLSSRERWPTADDYEWRVAAKM